AVTAESHAAEADALDGVVAVLVQDEGGAGAGRQDVGDQVDLVDVPPHALGERGGLVLVQLARVPVEVGARVGERGAAQREQPVDEPLPDVLDAGVQVDGEVEEVGQAEAAGGRRLQDVQALDDQDVGA